MLDKYIVAISLTLIAILISYLFASLVLLDKVCAQEPIVCEWVAGDVGHITGLGDDLLQAQGNAVKECFNRRIELYKKFRNTMPSEEISLNIIDSCINIKCGDKK